MTYFKITAAALGLAILATSSVSAQTASGSDQSQAASGSEKPAMSHKMMMVMQHCQAMSHDAMMKNHRCAAMMKAHPEMMQSGAMTH